MEKTIGTAFYRSSKGVTVKPRTCAEEQELLRLSENNKRIQKLRKQLAELEKTQAPAAGTCARSLEEFFGEHAGVPSEKWADLETAWNEACSALPEGSEAREMEAARILRQARTLRREITQAELEQRSQVSGALEKVAALRRDADKLNDLMFSVGTSAGTEEIDAQVNDRTAERLKEIQARTEAISAELQKNGAELPEALETELSGLSEELRDLPEKARSVFTAEAWRQEQARNVHKRLVKSFWKIRQAFTGGGLFDDVSFAVENASGDRALISFTIEGEVRIDSQFAGPGGTGRREKLQSMVLGTLIDGGARSAEARCMDEAPHEPEPAVRKDESHTEPSAAAAAVPVRQEPEAKKQRREGVGG